MILDLVVLGINCSFFKVTVTLELKDYISSFGSRNLKRRRERLYKRGNFTRYDPGAVADSRWDFHTGTADKVDTDETPSATSAAAFAAQSAAIGSLGMRPSALTNVSYTNMSIFSSTQNLGRAGLPPSNQDVRVERVCY